ncbi:hypothetical protein EGI31_19505 [Lacihabitans soyangensis]|uniref:CHAP domain-containing protein n=1 Tax=Lacihabitans soyangensis TaxID=869394 RepID=A0AAE3KW66_9BACT|nr:hypothetical protein [Lacihabitans soyangensis]
MLSDSRVAVIEVAKKDVGLIEGKSNTGFTQKYAQRWNEAHPKGKLALNSAYCGLAVWYWYRGAGLDPNISFSPRALNWKTNCVKPVSFFGLTIKDIEGIPMASAVVYKNSWGNHVGLFEKAIMADIYTYEGNTSSARSVTKYPSRKEGVFYLKTSVNNKDLKPIYYCDCIKQSKAI